jgi:carbon monoxide dehydrogenase subunit G
MLEVTASAIVPAPAERVFELLSDTARYPEWVTGTEAVTRTDGPAREGSTYDEVNPILGPWKASTHWRVVEHQPPRRSRHTTGDIPLSSHFEVEMEVASEQDVSEVTLTLRGEPSLGPIGALFARFMQGQVDRDNRRSVEAFAELAARELSAA